MKRLINKLFEKLGYVPKEEYDDILKTAEDLQRVVDIYDVAAKDISEGCVQYYLQKIDNLFVVFSRSNGCDNDVECPVKAFRFTEDTQDYARICAEELCDMLNEKY